METMEKINFYTLDSDEVKQLILSGGKCSSDAAEFFMGQRTEYNENLFKILVDLAKLTKGSDTAKTIIKFIKETEFDFYPSVIIVREELCNIAVLRKDEAATYALEAFAELSKKKYKSEDKYYLRSVINNTKHSAMAETAFKLLRTIFLEKKDKYLRLEDFWDIHLNCNFKHPSFLAFKLCLENKYCDSWTERTYLSAFRFHDTKRN